MGDPLTIGLLALGALGVPGAVKDTASTMDDVFGTDILNYKRRSKEAFRVQAGLGDIMASQGFDGIVDQLALDASLNAGPLNIESPGASLSLEEQTFAQNLIRANQAAFRDASSSPKMAYKDVLAKIGMM